MLLIESDTWIHLSKKCVRLDARLIESDSETKSELIDSSLVLLHDISVAAIRTLSSRSYRHFRLGRRGLSRSECRHDVVAFRLHLDISHIHLPFTSHYRFWPTLGVE